MNNEDRELLELTAKAAGLDFAWVDKAKNLPAVNFKMWNPLTDDGDALRLAVKLNMALTCTPIGDMHAEGLTSEYACENLPDRYAATRRAIVRAAAEIGKQMKGE